MQATKENLQALQIFAFIQILSYRGAASFDEKSETVIFSESIESVTGRPLEYERKASLPQGHSFLSSSQFANPTDRDKKDENQVDSASRIRILTPDELEHENTELQIGSKKNKFPLQPLEEERDAGLGDLSLLPFRLTPKKLAETEIDSRLPRESFSLLEEGKITGSLSGEDDSTSFRGKGEDGRDLDQGLSDYTPPTNREAKGDGSVFQDVGSLTFGDQRLVPRNCWPFGCHNTFSKQALESHNYYRRIHKAGDLRLSHEISTYAQEWAEKLASEGGNLRHRLNGKYGENLWAGTFLPTGHQPVDHFYTEEQLYRNVYGRTPASNGAGHFTQLVWRNSKKLGVGLAQSSGGVWVAVFNYDPRGNTNVGGGYAQNVLAPTEKADNPPTAKIKPKKNQAVGSAFPDGLIPDQFFAEMGPPWPGSQRSGKSKSRSNFGYSASGLRKSRVGSKSFKDVAVSATRSVKRLASKVCGSGRKSKKERSHDFSSFISQDGEFTFPPPPAFPIRVPSSFSSSLDGSSLFPRPPLGGSLLFPSRTRS
ncbi:unnamed protein product [Bemisia tabaci]|uniref:SCP domain-containing protein n=1 Tax=Bemisia tabaci TaxID=7038 RepID=A0A9P0AC82_BEMTA|nr:unnamed protein product [Bemisia tabaci]